jgi:hypothetical protein
MRNRDFSTVSAPVKKWSHQVRQVFWWKIFYIFFELAGVEFMSAKRTVSRLSR